LTRTGRTDPVSRFSQEITDRMSYLAQHDPLTGLLNRYAFRESFEQAKGLARKHRKKMVMLFSDLDNFKDRNDTLGHINGDIVLNKLSREILASVRVTDHVCRYGGDEFAILLSDIEQPELAFAVVDKIQKAASSSIDINGQSISVKLSTGISVYPDNGETLEALLSYADAAMYQIKASKSWDSIIPQNNVLANAQSTR